MDRRRVCIFSGADRIDLPSYINHKIYALEYGYDYRLEPGAEIDIKRPPFTKIAVARRLLPKYDWLLWVDDDVFFTDFTKDTIEPLIMKAEIEGVSIVMAEDREQRSENAFIWNELNTGMILLKNSARSFEFLDRMLSTGRSEVESWWDPEKFGNSTGGDQDVAHYLVFGPERFADDVLLVEQCLMNSRPFRYTSDPTEAASVHFCGYPDRYLGLYEFAEKVGLTPYIVPQNLLTKYSVRRPLIATKTEFYYRSIHRASRRNVRRLAMRLGIKDQAKSLAKKVGIL